MHTARQIADVRVHMWRGANFTFVTLWCTPAMRQPRSMAHVQQAPISIDYTHHVSRNTTCTTSVIVSLCNTHWHPIMIVLRALNHYVHCTCCAHRRRAAACGACTYAYGGRAAQSPPPLGQPMQGGPALEQSDMGEPYGSTGMRSASLCTCKSGSIVKFYSTCMLFRMYRDCFLLLLYT